jgi:hypothetical protein
MHDISLSHKTQTYGIKSLPGGTFTASNTVTPNTGTPAEENAYGCVSTGTDSYCMLAPLPGIGELDANGKPTGKINVRTGVGAYLNGVIRLILGLIGVLSVFMIVVGGIEYMSTVSIGEKEGAKSRIVNALMGLLLALTAYIILRTINPDLVNINIVIPKAELSLQPNPSVNPENTTDIKAPDGTTRVALCKQIGGKVDAIVSHDGGFTKAKEGMILEKGVTWPLDNGEPITTAKDSAGQSQIIYNPENERSKLPAGVTVNAASCTYVGQKNCTTLYGLPAQSFANLKTLQTTCANCAMVVTGGTECWAHASHGPGLTPIDLRIGTSALDTAIRAGKRTCTKWGAGTGGFCNKDASSDAGSDTGYNWQYTVGSIQLIDEGDHWHMK